MIKKIDRLAVSKREYNKENKEIKKMILRRYLKKK